MFWHIIETINTGRFEPQTRIKPACNGSIDNDLFLLVQKFNAPTLVADKAMNLLIFFAQIIDHALLLVARWASDRDVEKFFWIEPQARRSYACRATEILSRIKLRS